MIRLIYKIKCKLAVRKLVILLDSCNDQEKARMISTEFQGLIDKWKNDSDLIIANICKELQLAIDEFNNKWNINSLETVES